MLRFAILVLLCFFRCYLFVNYEPIDPDVILFGQSTALSGSSSEVGKELRDGISAAFHEINERGGISGGKKIKIQSLDDGYEVDQCVNNTNLFLDNPDIFGLIGYYGTPGALAVKDDVISEGIPFIGPFTGALAIRNPFQREFVNVRFSYDDEIASIVTFIVRLKQKFRFSIIYQNDSFGIEGYEALERILDPYGLSILSEGTYTRNQLDVEDAVSSIAAGDPEVIILVGTHLPMAKFVSLCLNSSDLFTITPATDILYLTLSFCGTKAFQTALYNYGIEMPFLGITLPFPPILELEDEYPDLSAEFRNAITDYSTHESRTIDLHSFALLEGYLTGRFTIQILKNIEGNFTRENFLDAVYDRKRFFLSDGFSFGPYYDADEDEPCNQGSHQVHPILFKENYTYEYYESMVYSFPDSCFSNVEDVLSLLIFKQSTAMTGSYSLVGNSLYKGLLASFYEFNAKYLNFEFAFTRRLLHISVEDDQLLTANALNNTKKFLYSENDTFALVGYIGTSIFENISPLLEEFSSIPFLCPMTGSPLLRENNRLDSVINIREGYRGEGIAQIDALLNLGVKRISLFYINNEFGLFSLEVVEDTLAYIGMSIFSQGYYELSLSIDLQDAFDSIFDSSILPEGIILSGNPLDNVEMVKMIRNVSTDIYITTFSVGSIVFMEALYDENHPEYLEKIYVSQVVPDGENGEDWPTFLGEYQNAIAAVGGEINFASLEGYICGRMITETMDSFDEEDLLNIASQDFLDKIYEIETYSFHDEVYLGPFRPSNLSTNSSCNQGLEEIWLSEVKNDSSKLYFDVFDFIDFHTENHVHKTSYSWCYCDKDEMEGFLPIPIYFGQSIDLSKYENYYFSMGIEYIFDNYKDTLKSSLVDYSSKNEYYLKLLVLDDEGDLEKRKENTKVLVDEKEVISLVGYERGEFDLSDPKYSTDTGMIGAKKTILSNIERSSSMVNMFPPHYDFIKLSLDYFMETKGFKQSEILVLLLQDQTANVEILEDLRDRKGFNIIEITETNADSMNTTIYILDNTGFEVLVLVDVDIHFFYQVYNQVSSPISSASLCFIGMYDSYFLSFYFSSSTFYFATQFDRSDDYQNSVDSVGFFPYFDSLFCGLIIGGLIVANTLDIEEIQKIAPQMFIQHIFDAGSIFLSQDSVFGPFSDECNVGLTDFYLYDSNMMEVHHVDYDGPLYVPPKSYTWIIIPILSSLLIVCCLCCCFCCALFLIISAVSGILIKMRIDRIVTLFEGDCFCVFTDIQGSSSIWRKQPAAMKVALKIHNAVFRRNIKKFGGTEVKFIGDSFFLLFPNDPINVLNFCFKIQQDLLLEEWPQKLNLCYAARTEFIDSNVKLMAQSSDFYKRVGGEVSTFTKVTGRRKQSMVAINRRNPTSCGSGGGFPAAPSLTSAPLSSQMSSSSIERSDVASSISSSMSGFSSTSSKNGNAGLLFNGLRVRMALNFCEKVDAFWEPASKRYDYVAPGINKCARIEEIALGGQVCVTKEFVDVLFSSDVYRDQYLGRGKIFVESLGNFSLEGVGDSEIFEVVSKELKYRKGKYDKPKKKRHSKTVLKEDDYQKKHEKMKKANEKLKKEKEEEDLFIAVEDRDQKKGSKNDNNDDYEEDEFDDDDEDDLFAADDNGDSESSASDDSDDMDDKKASPKKLLQPILKKQKDEGFHPVVLGNNTRIH